MDLEINIKVPLGAGVSVTQNAQPASEADFAPPPISELVPSETSAPAVAPPPSLEELGLAPEPRTDADSVMAPPSLRELGLDEAAAPAEEAEPPPLEMLEGIGAVGSDEAMLPPSLEELEIGETAVPEDLAPPSLEALGMAATPAEPTTGAPRPAGRSARKAKAKSASRKA